MKHIGIIGCSAEGASLCYRTICVEGADYLGPYGHPEISMHTPPLNQYIKHLDKGDLPGVGELMLASAQKLAVAGADFLICPDNTIHQALPLIEDRLPLPLLHIADAVVQEAKARGYQTLALTGTQWLVESDVYPDKLKAHAIDCIRPQSDVIATINDIIMNELVLGRFNPDSVDKFCAILSDFKDDGCDAVILGCTEIPLIVNDENSPLPTLDSTRLLARGALKMAISDR